MKNVTFKNEDDEDEVQTSTVAKSLVTDIKGIIKTPEMYITLTRIH